MANFDKFDQQILSALQSSGDTTAAQLAERIGLSTNACWRRIKKLEESGVIRRHVALLDEAKLGLNVTVFVGIKTNEHNDVWLEKFASGIKAIPEVIEFYRMSGDTDYLLKIVVKDIDDYDRVYKKIIAVTPLHDVSSSFAMERIKSSTELPIG
jgi:Lrp/AsnC family transcriptional regulator